MLWPPGNKILISQVRHELLHYSSSGETSFANLYLPALGSNMDWVVNGSLAAFSRVDGTEELQNEGASDENTSDNEDSGSE